MSYTQKTILEKEGLHLLKERLLSSDNILDVSIVMKATFKIWRISSALAQSRLASIQEVKNERRR